MRSDKSESEGNDADGNRSTTDTGRIAGKRYRGSKPPMPDLGATKGKEKSEGILSMHLRGRG